MADTGVSITVVSSGFTPPGGAGDGNSGARAADHGWGSGPGRRPGLVERAGMLAVVAALVGVLVVGVVLAVMVAAAGAVIAAVLAVVGAVALAVGVGVARVRRAFGRSGDGRANVRVVPRE